MGIPYEPDAAVEGVSTAIDTIRALWAGERLPSATPGLPPIQPMFPPTHRIPIVIAAYRKAFVELAGQKADGYLARPAESIPSLRGILERLHASAVAAGRDPGSLETAGYLLSLVDKTRREALNRAKREPFVIYMMSVLSDVSLAARRLRYANCVTGSRPPGAPRTITTAGNLIPDELLDAFMLCGTREDVAAGAMAFHAGTGLHLPLLQPVLQEDRQIAEMIAAARSSVGPGPGAVRHRAGGAASGSASVPSGRSAARQRDRSASRSAWPTTGSSTAGARPPMGRRALRDPAAVRVHRLGRSRSWPARALAWVDELWNWAPVHRGVARRRSSSTPGRTSSTRSTTFARASTRSRQPARQPRDRQGPHDASARRSLIAGDVLRPRGRRRARISFGFAARRSSCSGSSGSIGGWGYTAPPLRVQEPGARAFPSSSC